MNPHSSGSLSTQSNPYSIASQSPPQTSCCNWMQAMNLPGLPTAQQVGDAITSQYYFVMKYFPDYLHNAYLDNSRIGRPGQDGRMLSYTLEDINDENLNMLSSGDFDSVEVTNVMSQDSLGVSVLVYVDGYFSLYGRLEKNFTQVFFLALQDTGYFILNDILHLYDVQPTPKDGSQRVSEQREGGSNISDASVVRADAVVNNPEFVFASYETSSVYIQNLPAYDTYNVVVKAFSWFGQLKTVEIRNPDNNYHYGFLEFEDADAAQKAIMVSPLMIGGRRVHVGKKYAKDYWKRVEIYEEERGQHNQNRFRTTHLSGTGVYDFWHWVESMEEHSNVDEKVGEERGVRDYDYWEWQRSMMEQSRLRQGDGGTGVDHSRDNEQIMEEQRKFGEECRKIKVEPSRLRQGDGGTGVDDSWEFEQIMELNKKFEKESKNLEEEQKKKHLEEEQQKQLEEELKKLEEEGKKLEEEDKKLEEKQKKLEEKQKKRLEEEQKKRLEEELKKLEEEDKKLEEKQKKFEEKQKKRLEEEQKKRLEEEEQKKQLEEEEQKKQLEEKQKKLEEEQKKLEEEQKKLEEEEQKKQLEEEEEEE